MNKIFFIITCFLIFVSIANAELVQDKSGEFSFICPKGWEKIDVYSSPHSILRWSSKDGTRNIMIFDEFEKGPLPEIKKMLEEDSQKKQSYKNTKIISSNIVKLKNEKQAIRIIKEIEYASRRDKIFRQIHYIVALKSGKRITIVCTIFKKDGDSYDSVFDNFVNSIN